LRWEILSAALIAFAASFPSSTIHSQPIYCVAMPFSPRGSVVLPSSSPPFLAAPDGSLACTVAALLLHGRRRLACTLAVRSPRGELAARSRRELQLDNVEMTPQELPDSIAPDLDSVIEVPDSVTLDNVEPLDSVEEVPDSVEEVQCPRCGTFHAGGVFGEACFQARCNARRCARCGLLHEDYDVPARFLYGVDKFDCEFFIPDVEKLEMHGNTIILPEEVVKKLEEHDEKMKQTKISPQANKEDEAKQDQ